MQGQILKQLVFLILIIFMVQPVQAAMCQSQPNLAAMDNDFLFYLTNQAGARKDNIAVLPFFDNHVGNPDESFYYGIPFFIYEVFSSKKSNILNPYLSLSAIRSLGMANGDLIAKHKIKAVASKLNVRYVIFGEYQQSIHNTMRVMINVYDAKKEDFLDSAVSFSSDVNDSLLNLIKEKVSFAYKEKTRRYLIEEKDYKTPSLEAFKYYATGLPLAAGYQQANLEMAVIWFEKGLKQEYHKYDDAALSLARSYFMLALMQKLNGVDYTLNWTKGKKALSFVQNKYRHNPEKHELSYRFIESQNFTAQAMTAFVVKNFKRANQLATSGLKLVPEDGLLQQIYLTTLGSRQPKKELRLTNPVCF